MTKSTRLFKSFSRLLLPVVLLVVVAVGAGAVWMVYTLARPAKSPYLVTPNKYGQLSTRAAQVTEETWANRDSSTARGWLLRGAEGSPAIILLHRYGADRSWLLNLGVKLNETTNFTVLWPDLRGHGVEPPVSWTSFGGRETEDVGAALDYLRSLKTQERPLVGPHVGLYGVELGAYAALRAGAGSESVRALVLDSVPDSPNEVLNAAVRERTGLNNSLLKWLARNGTRIYFISGYDNTRSCEAAAKMGDRRVLLLAGNGPEELRASTLAVAQCFPNPAGLEVRGDLPLTGYNLPSATGEQGEAYDRRVIDFFDRALRANP